MNNILLTESDSDLHIYMDDLTGDYYYFDGEKLVKLGGKPQIGSRGNEDIQKAEEEQRKAQIEAEKAESGESDDNSLEDSEGEKARIDAIKNSLENDELRDKITHELQEPVNKAKRDKARKEAEEARRAEQASSMGTLADFKLTLEKFIKNELADERQTTYSKLNKKYARSGLIKPGVTRHGQGKIPSMNVYFDQSGSWGPSDIQAGEQAVATLRKYEKEQKIKIFVYYFATNISTTPSGIGGGTDCVNVVEHIAQTRPDNVIIMSDDDGQGQKYPGTARVPGAVWFLWRNSSSPDFRRHVVGRKENKQFMIN